VAAARLWRMHAGFANLRVVTEPLIALPEHAAVLDDARPEAVARQHALGKLTARERIARLLDDGSFRELGGRRSVPSR
jgi:acetyl-CoA carboxylase carboxyltransferase component